PNARTMGRARVFLTLFSCRSGLGRSLPSHRPTPPSPDGFAPHPEDTPVTELPPPECRCFVLCRWLFVDPVRQDFTLVPPVHQVFAPHYPLTEDLSVFARWSNAHGAYTVEVQLRSLDGDILWRHQMERPFAFHNPLLVVILTLPHLRITIPA